MHDIDQLHNPTAFIDFVGVIFCLFHTRKIILELTIAIGVLSLMFGMQEVFILLLRWLVMKSSFRLLEDSGVSICGIFAL